MNEIKTVRMTFPSTRLWRAWEGFSCVVDVLWLGGDRYQMKDVSNFVPLGFDDEFVGELRKGREGDFEELVVTGRTRKSGYRRWSGMANPDHLEGRMAPALRMLEEAGGRWCVEFGGFFAVAVPPGFDLEAFKQRLSDPDRS